MIVIVALCILAVIYFALLYYYNYSCANKTLPHLGGIIPYLGHAMAFSKNPFAFIKAAQKKYGDAFSVYVMGRKMIIMTNVHDGNYVVMNKEFTMDKLTILTSTRSFGIRHETLLVEEGEVYRKTFKHVHMFLQQPKDLDDITRRAQENFEKFFFDEKNKTLQQGKLYDFIADSVFTAALAALVGDDYFDFSNPTLIREIKNSYYEFDKQRNVLETDLPDFAKKQAVEAREKFASYFRKPITSTASAVLQARYQLYKPHVEDEKELGRLICLIVWVAMTNTIPAAFWVLANVLTRPEVYKEIMEEITEVVSANKPSADKKGPLPWFSQDMFMNMKKLQATIDEALRFYSSVFLAREASKDMTVTFPSGRKVEFKKDEDVMVIAERVSHDEQLYENDDQFQWDRFLHKKSFMRNGKEVSFNQAFLTFGAGTHKCPGRFFAMNEIKILLALMLLAFDIKLLDTKVPGMAYHEFSGGLLPPSNDMAMEYKIKDAYLN